MSDVNANIGVHIDTSQALAELKSLQRQLATFYSSISKSSAAAVNAQRNLQLNLLSNINASGQFATSIGTIRTSTEAFTGALEKNKFSMREYFRYAGGATKTFGRVFKNEFDTIGKVAEDRVKKLQTQYIKIGRDSTGAMRAIAITPNTLDLKDYGTQAQIAAQRQALFNQLVKQGSTNLLNFGKNTQWAGRQLMVGFTLPLATLGVTATRTFMDMETAAIKFRKVYGDLGTSPEESKQALAGIQELAKTYTQYGVAVKDTVALAADAAAAGFKGIALEKQTAAATRLSVLGQIDAQQALQTTISLQNAFAISSEDLASTIEFLNAVENQTVTSLDDITIAIPKAAPVVQQLGGNVKDLAFFLTAMKEGGVNASEGANALKSGLASIINPSKKASDLLATVGINLRGIVDKNKGNLKQTVLEFAQALDTLAPLDRARAIETMFGKFQFARISTLLQNITKDGTQASRVLDLANASAEDLATLAQQELGVTAESAMNKFRGSVEKLRLALVPIGETLLQVVSPIVDFVGKVLDRFNNLSEGVQKAIVVLTVAIGGIGPIALMTFGLLANGLANVMKGAMVLRQGYLRLTGQSKNLGEQTQYLNTEQLDAAAVAHSLDQSHAKLTQTFNVETSALNSLIAAYQRAVVAGQQFAFNNPGMMKPGMPRRKYASGGIVTGPGTGTSDSIAAMVSNGEAIVPARQTKKYGPLIRGIIADNIPGFAGGRIPIFAENALRLQSKRENISHMASTTDSESVLAVLAARVGEAMGIPVTQSKVSAGKFDQIANDFQGITTKFVDNVNKDFTETFAHIQNTDERFAKSWMNAGRSMEKEVNAIANDVQRGVVRKVFGIDEDVYSTIPTAPRKVGGNVPQRARKGAFTKSKYGISSYTRISGGVKALFQRRTGATAEELANLQLGHVLPPMYADINSLAADPQKSGAVKQAMQTMQAQGRAIADKAIKATAVAAQVASPSRRTIAIGKDIAAGLKVGMEQGSDAVVQGGTALSDKAIKATQSRVALYGEGPIDPGQKSLRRQLEKQQRQVRIGDLAANAAVSQQTLNTAKQNAAILNQANARMASLNKAFMAGTFALTAFSGITSMAGGNLGKFSDIIFQISGPIFALSSIIQMITGSKILEFIGKFKVGLGLGALALTAVIGGYKLISSSMEKHRMQLEGLSDAMKSTAEQTKFLGDFFGVAAKQTPYELGQQKNLEKDVTSVVRSQREQLKADPQFDKLFGKTIESLQKANDTRVKLALSSIALEYKGKGFAEEQIQTIIDALREEAGKTDVTLDVKSLKLDEASLADMRNNLVPELENFRKEFAKSTEKTYQVRSVDKNTGRLITELQTFTYMTDKAKESLNNLSGFITNTSKNAAAMFRYGLIDGKQFESTIQTVMGSLDGLNEKARKTALIEIFTSMNKNAKEFIGNITNAQTQMKILALMSSGLLTGSGKDPNAEDYNPILGALSQPQGTKAFERGVAAVNREYERMFGWMDKLGKQEKELEGTKTLGDTGGAKSPLQQLKEKIKDMKEQSMVLKMLRDNNVEYATALDMASDATMRSLVLDAAKKGTLKGVVALMKDLTAATNKWSQVQAQLQTPEEKRLNYLDRLSAAVDLNEKLIDIQSAPKIKAYNDQIKAQEKALKGVNDQISKITKSQIDPIQAKIDANSFALEGIALKEDAINKKYDEQITALTKIETVNQNIANIQRQRLSLSDAITSGDISAAAQAVQEIRAQQTQDAISSVRDNLTNARDQQIAALGRVQLEQQNKELQYQISVIQQQQLLDLEKQKTQLEDNLQSLRDQLSEYEAQVEQSKENARYAGLTRQEIENQKDLITLARDAGIKYSEVLAGAASNAQAMASALLLSLQYQQAMAGLGGSTGDAGAGAGGGSSGSDKGSTGTDKGSTGATGTTSKTVKATSGQSLASIAKANGTTVAKILAANPKFTSDAKYNGGKTIFSGTTVKIPGKMYGGIVPGYGMVDSIPTMLTPGEFVMNRNATRKFLPALKQMNQSLYPQSFGSGSNPVVANISSSNTQFDRTVYNYNLSVTANSTNASADEIAQTVIAQIKRTDSQRIRSNRQ
jgi:TP901 family phage tail tape measure protein